MKGVGYTFLDVGGHIGQTLEEVTKPAYAFDRIVSFEPMPVQHALLCMRFGEHNRVKIHNVGLANHSGRFPLYGDNANAGASIYKQKNDVDAKIITYCTLVEASLVAELYGRTDMPNLIIKLNCEGAEVEILDNLIDTKMIWRAQAIMIDWDIRKVVGMQAEEQRVLARLAEIEFTRYQLCDDVMKGATHQDRIANWLAGVL